MNITHFNIAPVLYGLLVLFPIILLAWKMKKQKWALVMLDIFILTMLFKMHGAASEGRMSATVAAMGCSLILPYILFPKHWR